MSTNDVTTLRGILFDELRALGKDASAADLARAKAKNELAQTIINSAKVEVEAMRVIGGEGTGFIPLESLPGEGKPTVRRTGTGTVTTLGHVTRHKAS